MILVPNLQNAELLKTDNLCTLCKNIKENTDYEAFWEVGGIGTDLSSIVIRIKLFPHGTIKEIDKSAKDYYEQLKARDIYIRSLKPIKEITKVIGFFKEEISVRALIEQELKRIASGEIDGCNKLPSFRV